MAKLKNSFTSRVSGKVPTLGGANQNVGGSQPLIAKDPTGKALTPQASGSRVQALNFGSLHTKVTGGSNSSPWQDLLTSALSGGATSSIGGGILSSGAFGLVGKLLSLFGGSKSTPAAPTPFVMPASQQTTLNVGPSSASSSVSLGVSAHLSVSQSGPVYQQSASVTQDQATQSAQVVQVVRQALLTSSSLNDVISEI